MENKVNCTVTEFESTGSLIECLGMNEERADFLTKEMMHCFIDEDRYTAMVARMSKLCNHPNELAFVAMSIGKLAAKQQLSGDNPLAHLFGKR
jgi:hypothetical protein